MSNLNKRLSDLEQKTGTGKLPYLFLWQDYKEPNYYTGKDTRIHKDDIADLEGKYKIVLFSWGDAHPDNPPNDDPNVKVLDWGDD